MTIFSLSYLTHLTVRFWQQEIILDNIQGIFIKAKFLGQTFFVDKIYI